MNAYNCPPFNFNELYAQPPLNHGFNLYPNAFHPQTVAVNEVVNQEIPKNCNDEERQYHTLLPHNTPNQNTNGIANHALDFSITLQESDQNHKRKSTEPLDNPSQTKIANVNPKNTTNDSSNVNSENVSDDYSEEHTSEETQKNKKNAIYNLLTKSQRGKLILAAYEYDNAHNEKFKKFDKYASKLAVIVIDNEFMNEHYDIKRNRFLVLRSWICDLFDGQVPEQWYSPSSSSSTATGYLYTAYRRFRDQCIELDVFYGTVKESSKQANLNEVDVFKVTNIDNEFIKTWTSLLDNRKKCYKSQELLTLLDLYPCLALCSGYELILADFKCIYGSKHNELMLKWPELSTKIVNFAKLAKKQSLVKGTVDKYKELIDVSNEILAFILLQIILKPSNNNVIKKNCSLSYQDYIDIFIYEAKDFNDLENSEDFGTVHQHLENIYKNIEEESVKPYIVICGTFSTISATYVVLSKDCKYKVESLNKAVDIYMKLTLILCKAVSKPCKPLCQFFEFFIYSTNNKGIYRSVSNLAKNLS